MEVVGLTTGLISLAGLFSTCIDAFAYIKAGKNLERDVEILLVKLDIEKARLLSWGNAIGIARDFNDGRDAILNNQEATITSILENVRILLTDSHGLQNKYDFREVSESPQRTTTHRIEFVSRPGLSIFRGSFNRFWLRFGENRPLGAVRRVTWAINDREKFGNLIKDLRELVDGLVALAPTIKFAVQRTIEDDVAGLPLSSLRLADEAVSHEERYQELSDVISEAIEATEVGTIDRWLDDQSHTDEQIEPQPEASPATATRPLRK